MEVPFAGYDKRHEPLYSLDSPPSVPKGGSKYVKLIVGSADTLATKDDMKALQAKQRAQVDKAIAVIPNPDKKDNFAVDRAAYVKVLVAALKHF